MDQHAYLKANNQCQTGGMMRKLGTAVAALGMAFAGLTVPATTAQAAPDGATGPRCNQVFSQVGRDGAVRPYNGLDCNELLTSTEGNDINWNDSTPPFNGSYYNDSASSLMNNGYFGGRDVVAFYRNAGYRHQDGYGCLAPGEIYADDLRRNYYYKSGSGPSNISMNNSISSHQWVYASGCASGSWIT